METTQSTFQFVLSWIVVITLLTFANKTRVGHVIIYYSLMLMILFILLAEYKQIAPLISGIQSVGQYTTAVKPTKGILAPKVGNI